MATVKYEKLVESYQKWPDRAPQLLRESLESGDVDPFQVDFGRLFEAAFGVNEFRACQRDKSRIVTKDVYEAAGGVSTAAFKDISGQIVYSMTLQSYQAEEFVFSKIIPERQSPYSFEKVAGIFQVGPGSDSEWVVHEGEPYGVAGVGQNWVNMPETVKRGKIVPVTREAIFFDRTGQIQDRCKEVGYWLGYNREVRAVDCVIDENDGAKSAAAGGHRYHWQGTSIATYGDNSGTHSWDNLAASNALVDWVNVNANEQLLNSMIDPFTAAPIMVDADTLIVTKQLEKTALRILNSTEIRVATPGYAVSGNPTQTVVANPYAGKFQVVSTKLLATRLATDTSWFYGSPNKAFVYVVNFPFQTVQAPANSTAEFERDIVMQFRADERGAYGTLDPRLMTKATA